MNDCHQAQFHISQQLDHLTDNQRMDLSTDYRRQAAAQLETEVNCWFNSFCKFVKSQQDYVRALCRWIRLTGRLVDEQRQSLYSSAVHSFSDQWQLALDKLPDKVLLLVSYFIVYRWISWNFWERKLQRSNMWDMDLIVAENPNVYIDILPSIVFWSLWTSGGLWVVTSTLHYCI